MTYPPGRQPRLSAGFNHAASVGNSISYLNLKGLAAGGPFSLEENKDLLTPSLHLTFLIVTLGTIVITVVQNVKDYFTWIISKGNKRPQKQPPAQQC
ncbi:MAG: hypothetical protein E7243_17620 [Lacrimispora celerecrescens]|nr:hypothetical protein [Lacrimispora celerecrescens]